MHFYRPQEKEMLSQAFVSHSVRNRPNGYSSYWNAFLFPVCWLHSVTWFPQNMKLSMNRRGETSRQPPPPTPLFRHMPVKQQCIPVGCVPPTLYCTGGISVQGSHCPGAVSVQGDPPPINRITDRCKTLPHVFPGRTFQHNPLVAVNHFRRDYLCLTLKKMEI